MLESIPEVGPFLAGAVVGMGQGLGHKVMELLIKYLGLPRSAANKPGEAPTESTAGGGRERTAEQIQHAPSDEEELAHVVGSLHNEVDWKNMVNGLKQSGMPFDASAAQQLAALGDEVLKKTILPPHAAGRLAKLTGDAFERAGMELPDLARWQNLSRRLVDDEPLTPVKEDDGEDRHPSAMAVAVATMKRPGTWWVWSRAEVDRRLFYFVGRGVEHCWTACNQALTASRDLPALRQLRELREQLVLVRELLQTMTPLVPDKRELRVDAWRVKQLLSSLEQAVRATETLSGEMKNMLASQSGTRESQTAFAECGKAVAVLVQTLRDRRAVR